jgi:hypothetical protein
MNISTFKILAPMAAAGLVLTACGGGDSNGPDDLIPTGRSATVVVSNASTPALNGTYTSTSINLTEVVKLNRIGSEPEYCKFRFSGLQGPGGVFMDGDVRYLPGTNAIHVMFTSIAAVQFSATGATNAVVDRPNDRVTFAGKVFNPGTPTSITLTGTIPLPFGRPEGC